MTARHSTTGLPIPGAARFGRGRSPYRGNIAFGSRQNDGDSTEAATSMIAQHLAELDSAPHQPRHNIMARSHIGISDQAAHPLSP